MSTIAIREGDSYPEINITLRDRNTGEPDDSSSWEPIDLSGFGTSVRIDYRLVGETTIAATSSTTKVGDGTAGHVYFSIPAAVYNNIGTYSGEVVIVRDGETETVQERFKVKVKGR